MFPTLESDEDGMQEAWTARMAEMPTHATIDTIRKVLSDGPGNICGLILDIQTANMLLTIYNALGEANRILFERTITTLGGFLAVCEFGWSKVK